MLLAFVSAAGLAACIPAKTPAPTTQSCAPGTETYAVTNPTSGAELFVDVSRPSAATSSALPVVVLVPGGIGDSTVFTCRDNVAQQIAESGYVVVAFDPDGRGRSTGTEDEGGSVQQDGLAAVFDVALTLDGVDADRAAIVTSSYGIVMGSGAVVRHDLAVDALVDYEGPADRTDVGCRSGACDEAWWAQREAVTFVAQLDVPYVHVQSETDHAQADNDHALKLVNAAFAGGAPLVQLNAFVLTEELDAIPDGALLPDSFDRRTAEVFVDHLEELL